MGWKLGLSCAQINKQKVTQSLKFKIFASNEVNHISLSHYLLWVFGALGQFGENSPGFSGTKY